MHHIRKLFIFSLVFIGAFLFFFNSKVSADLGVGVGTGKIEVNELLKPGVLHTLPSITVFNTGTVTATYKVGVEYHQDQPELIPPREWFVFSPREFELEPGASQEVEMRLRLPFKAEPGRYFASVEGRPTRNVHSGETAIGIAAATKLYFDVSAANIFFAIFYRLRSWWFLYFPWLQIALVTILLYVIFNYLKKFINIDISLKPKKTKSKKK